MSREVQHVADRGRPEGIDGLGVVAHDSEGPATVAQGSHDVRLQAVGVLVLVDQDVVVGVGQGRPEGVVGGGRPPVQEKIVEVEQVVLALPPGVAAEGRRHQALLVVHPGKGPAQDVLERRARVDDARVDGDERLLARQPAPQLGPVRCRLVAGQLHEVSRVALVHDAEAVPQTQQGAVLAQHPVGDGVERPGVHLPRPGRPDQVAQPPDQLVRATPAERHQQQSLRRHATVDEPGQPGNQRPGLAGARPGHDEQRRPIVVHGLPLHRVQSGRPGLFHQTDDSALPEHMFGCVAGRTATPRSASRPEPCARRDGLSGSWVATLCRHRTPLAPHPVVVDASSRAWAGRPRRSRANLSRRDAPAHPGFRLCRPAAGSPRGWPRTGGDRQRR